MTMNSFFRRTFVTLYFLSTIAVIGFLAAPFIIDSFILPRVLEKIPILNKSASISRITPFSARGTLSFEDRDTPVAVIPRFELTYSPASLLKQRISSLVLDHAVIHLTRDNGIFTLQGFLHNRSEPVASEEPPIPFILPAAIETLIVKQCSVVIHEKGKADIRFTLSSRSHFSYSDHTGSGFLLSSAEGSFLVSDSMSVQGTISYLARPQKHIIAVDLKMDLAQLSEFLPTPFRSVLSGTLALQGTADLDTETFRIKEINASGELQQFQYQNAPLAVHGSDADSAVSFLVSGTPEDMHYVAGPLHVEGPLSLGSSITGSGSLAGQNVLLKGVVETMIYPPDTNGKDPLALSVSYDATYNRISRESQIRTAGKFVPKPDQELTYRNFRLLLPETSFTSAWVNTRDTMTAEIDLNIKNSTVHNNQEKMDISPVALTMSLKRSGPAYKVDVSGSIPGLSYPSAGLSFKDIAFSLPFSSPFSAENDTAQGSFTIDTISLDETALASISTRISQNLDAYGFKGTVSTRFSDMAALDIEGRLEPERSGLELAWKLDDAIIDSDELVPLPAFPEGLDFHASLSSTGKLSYRNQQFSGEAAATIEAASLLMPEQNISFDTISCTVEFPHLPEFSSKPSQLCRIGKLNVGTIVLSDALINFRIEDPETLFIEKSSLTWCQGRLESTSLRLSRNNPEINTALYCSKINFAELLNQFGLDQADGEGTLNGKLPIQVSRTGLYFDDGFLFSTPGTGGIIQFSNTDMLRQGVGAADVGGYLDYSMKAMEDFSYKWTKLSLNSLEDELLLTMELDGKPTSPLPYGFKNGKIIETDKGDGLQYPIRLDVNFRLPLADLFDIGQNLQSLKENL